MYEIFQNVFPGERSIVQPNSVPHPKRRCTFRIFFFGGGAWQAVSHRGGVTVMEKGKILVGWVTKVCLKCTKKLG